MNLDTRLAALERKLGPPPASPRPPAEISPEEKAVWAEVRPIIQAAVAEHPELCPPPDQPLTDLDRNAFWYTLGEVLEPYPELKRRVGEVLEKSIRENERRENERTGLPSVTPLD